MSNYTKSTNFATKDALTTGNPLKTVSGTEIDDEFTNIATAVATKANTSSPTLTGTPAAPTAASSTNSTQIATTAFTQAAIVAGITAKAPLASPALTGTPTAPTASASTNTTQVATTAYADAAVAALVIPPVTAAVVNALVYPVGSIFTTVTAYSASSLATLMGVGTWATFGAGRVLAGLDGGDSSMQSAGQTGGAKTDSHTLTINEIPSHVHGYTGVQGTGNPDGAGDSVTAGHANSYPRQTELDYEGGGAAHSHDIMQPYIVVYFWKRTA
tara:strand:- start:338 stop:1153 length:816 start_codon:yes stop_codon:yes gene_type:complete